MFVCVYKFVIVLFGFKSDWVQQYVCEGCYGLVSEVLCVGVEVLEQQDVVLEGVLKVVVVEVIGDLCFFVLFDEVMVCVYVWINE